MARCAMPCDDVVQDAKLSLLHGLKLRKVRIRLLICEQLFLVAVVLLCLGKRVTDALMVAGSVH